jgi:hypothetical protein
MRDEFTPEEIAENLSFAEGLIRTMASVMSMPEARADDIEVAREHAERVGRKPAGSETLPDRERKTG